MGTYFVTDNNDKTIVKVDFVSVHQALLATVSKATVSSESAYLGFINIGSYGDFYESYDQSGNLTGEFRPYAASEVPHWDCWDSRKEFRGKQAGVLQIRKHSHLYWNKDSKLVHSDDDLTLVAKIISGWVKDDTEFLAEQNPKDQGAGWRLAIDDLRKLSTGIAAFAFELLPR